MDDVTVHQVNENRRTIKAVQQWKSWALRTIAEGAYKKGQPMMMSKQSAFRIGLTEFKTIVFWESYVCHSEYLEDIGYLDIAIPQSNQSFKCGKWDDVREWIGMGLRQFFCI